MGKLLPKLSSLFILAFVALGSTVASAQSSVRKAIEMADAEITDAIKKGDAGALAVLYTEDGKLMPPNGDFIVGRKNIQEFWRSTMQEGGVKRMDLQILEVYSQGPIATELGTYTVSDCSGKQL